MKRAAIIDLDGTLLRGTSAERLLIPFLHRRGMLGLRQWVSLVAQASTFPLAGLTYAFRHNKRYLAGTSVRQVLGLVPEFLSADLAPRFCPALIERIDVLRESGYGIFLLSGTPQFVAEAVGSQIGAVESRGTTLEMRDGRFTGRVAGPHYFGAEKVRAAEDLARRHGLDLASCYAFADSPFDIPLLRSVGHPVAVSPKPGLKRYARRRGWEVLAG